MQSTCAQKTEALGKVHRHYSYCVRTATLVEPRTTSPVSLNSIMMRLLAASNGTLPVAVTNTEYVGVAPPLTELVVLLPGVDRQAPVAGFVSQMDTASGKVTDRRSDAVIVAVLPTFTVATAKAFEPLVPGKSTMPSPVDVAASATMSGTGTFDADSSSVFRPVVTGAGLVLEQSKINFTSVELNAAVGVKAIMYVCRPSATISTGVFGVPTSALVAGSDV